MLPLPGKSRTCLTTCVIASTLALGSNTFAQEPATTPIPVASAKPFQTSGSAPQQPPHVVRDAEDPTDPARRAANIITWLPRNIVELAFLTTGAAAGLIENQQVVPRVRQLLFSRDGSIGVFPTLFLETGSSPNVGARMVASADNVATTLRGGYGGPDTNVVESRMRFARAAPFPMVLSIEGLHERRTDRGFRGIGQTPESDPRNRFLSDLRTATFRERRERAIASFGVRPAPDVEIFLSTSYAQRAVDDIAEGDAPGFASVFVPGSMRGPYETTRLTYTELAVRADTREVIAAPSPGLLVEGYAGAARGVGHDSASFLRAGARAAGFISVYRKSNVLSPRVVIDGLSPQGGEQVPFQELTGQSAFRGFDNRRDFVSVVTSLDYRWKFASFVGARVFGDLATVAPSLRELSTRDLRWVGGFSVELFSSDADVARVGFAAGPEGTLFLLSFGVPARYGDRQHRD